MFTIFLCEDTQHDTFLRYFFKPTPGAYRIEKNSKGKGSGEQFVREKFPNELTFVRRKPSERRLVVMIDADTSTIPARLQALRDVCIARNVPKHEEKDPVAIFIPKRNIETWIHYLRGKDINEDDTYDKLPMESDCSDAVKVLKTMCDNGQSTLNCPTSLTLACREYREKILL